MNRLPVLPLPKKPLKPYISKPMTIGVGFESAEGVVLGADQQMTRPGYNKFFQPKIFHTLTDHCGLGLVGAGDIALTTEVWDKLQPAPTISENKANLEAILNEMGRLYTDLPIELLLGIATKDEVGLIEFRGKGLQFISSFGVIGCGDSSLIRYLSDKAEKFWVGMDQAFAVTVYMLKRAEEYIDGCHGPMDIIALMPGPRLQIFNPESVDRIDAYIKQKEDKAFKDLLSISYPSPT